MTDVLSALPAVPRLGFPAWRWTVNRITLALVISLLPPAGVALFQNGPAWLLTLAVALVTIVSWQALFALVRRRPMALDGPLVALVIAIVIPPALPLWQVVLAASFGIVAGQEIFGGRGRSFLSPAVVALAFLMFSFPGLAFLQLGSVNAFAVVPGALFLMATGLISWRLVAAAAVAFALSALAGGVGQVLPGLIAGGFVFGTVFFAADPVAAASTNAGRIVHGALYGALVVLLGGAGGGNPLESVVFAALLASVLAPLIDQAAIRANLMRRRWRDG